eukprot:2740424-Prymnesium_polylepis.1
MPPPLSAAGTPSGAGGGGSCDCGGCDGAPAALEAGGCSSKQWRAVAKQPASSPKARPSATPRIGGGETSAAPAVPATTDTIAPGGGSAGGVGGSQRPTQHVASERSSPTICPSLRWSERCAEAAAAAAESTTGHARPHCAGTSIVSRPRPTCRLAPHSAPAHGPQRSCSRASMP